MGNCQIVGGAGTVGEVDAAKLLTTDIQKSNCNGGLLGSSILLVPVAACIKKL